MTIFIRRFIYFSLTLCCCFGLLNLFRSYYNTDPMHYKLKYNQINSNSIQETEGIIIGTSHAAHAIRPSIINRAGIKFYNHALNSSNPTFYLKWYKYLLSKRCSKLKYCIIQIDWFMFEGKSLWRDFEHDSEHFPFTVFMECLSKPNDFDTETLITNRFPCLKYRTSILNSLKLVKGDERYIEDTYDDGFIEYKIPFRAENFKQTVCEAEIIDKRKLDFNMLIKEISEDGAKIIFVMIPEFGINIKEYEASETLKYINNFSNVNQIPFINFNTTSRTTMNDSIKNFADWGHMNGEGSEKFSLAFEIELEKLLK
jgi:hypothetical protein